MKLDLGKILKSINKGERPSSDTLYVSSKNDPRLKAYQDSSTLHNLSLKLSKKPKYSFLNDSDGLKVLNNIKRISAMSKIEPILGRKNSGVYFKKPERPVAYKKPTVDTLYVDNPNDKRLRAYQDSLALIKGPYESYNRSRVIDNLIENDNFEKAKKLLYSGYLTNVPGSKAYKNLTKYNKKNPEPIKGSSMGWGLKPGDKAFPIYKKPTQPVALRKKEEQKTPPVKQNIEQVKKEVLQAIQNKYEGNPVYSSTAGSGGPSALVGFENRGDTTFIKPEDFDRFAVPKYARQFIQNKSKKK